MALLRWFFSSLLGDGNKNHVAFWRDRDLDDPNRNRLDTIAASDSLYAYTERLLSFDTNQTFYFRIIRAGNEFRQFLSTDGVTYSEELISSIFTADILNQSQALSIRGSSFIANTGSYADFDYIRINFVPGPSVPAPNTLLLLISGLLAVGGGEIFRKRSKH
jgi:hypothetical protein